MPPARKRLGELLVEAGVLDAMQLQAALGIQRQWGGKLGSVLVERKFISEPKLVATLAQQLNVPVIQIAKAKIDPRATALVPAALCAQLHVFPLELKGPERTETLVVAMSDPTDLSAIDQLQFRTRKRIQAVLAGDKDINAAIRRHYYHEDAPPPADSIPGNPKPAEASDAPFKDAHLLGSDGDDDLVPGLVAYGGDVVKKSVPAPPAAAVPQTPFAPMPFAPQPVPTFGTTSPFLQAAPPQMPPMSPPGYSFGAPGARGPTGTPVAVPAIHPPLVMTPPQRPSTMPVMEPRGTPSQPVPLPPKASDIDPFAELDEPATIAAPRSPGFDSAAPAAAVVTPIEAWDTAEPELPPAEDNSWIDPVSAAISDDDPLAGGTGQPAEHALEMETVEEAATIVPSSGWNDEVVDAASQGWMTPADEETAPGGDALATPSEVGVPSEEDSWSTPSEGAEPSTTNEWEAGSTQPISLAPAPPSNGNWFDQSRHQPAESPEAAAAPVEGEPLNEAGADVPIALESGWETAAAQSWTSKPPEEAVPVEQPIDVAAEDIEEIEEAQLEEDTSRVAVSAEVPVPEEVHLPTGTPEEAAAAESELDMAWSEPSTPAPTSMPPVVEEPAAVETAGAWAGAESGEPVEAVEAAPAAEATDWAAADEAPPAEQVANGDAAEWAATSEPGDVAAAEVPTDATDWATAEEAPAEEPVAEAPAAEEVAVEYSSSEAWSGFSAVAEAAAVEVTPVAEEEIDDAPALVEAAAEEVAAIEEVPAEEISAAEEAPLLEGVPAEEAAAVEAPVVEEAPIEELAAAEEPALETAPAVEEVPDASAEITPVGPVSGSGMLAPDEAGLSEEPAQIQPEEAELLAQAAPEEAPVEAVEPEAVEAVAEEVTYEAAAEEAVPESAEEVPAEVVAEELPAEPVAEELPAESVVAEEPIAEEVPAEATSARGWQLLGISQPSQDDAVAVVGALVDVLVARGSISAEELLEAIQLTRETPAA